MAKKRRGRVAPVTPKGKRKRSSKKSAAKRSTARRPVVSDPDSDVFLASCSGVAPYTQTLNTNDDDSDDDVFIPSPGRPVMVQADWVDDTGATVRHGGDPSVWEPFQGLRPRAGSPVHWSKAELYAHGLELRQTRNGPRVVCRFGCDGTTTNVAGVSSHSYKCAYWTRDGHKHETPF